MTGPAPAPRFGQFYFTRKTATAYELYIFGGATAEFAPVLLNDLAVSPDGTMYVTDTGIEMTDIVCAK